MKITVTASRLLFDLLQEQFPATSRTVLRKMLRRDRVTLDGRVVRRADSPLQPGQVIEVSAGRKGAVRPPCEILHRDEHVLAVAKPAGLLSVGRDRPGEDTLHRRLNDFVQAASGGRERVFIVHRLDQAASGIMVFALSPEVQDRLQTSWPSTEKRYWALVEGCPPEDEGTIRSWLRENREHRVYSTVQGPETKFAVTHFRVHQRGPVRSVLEVSIETGRKNQIRVHLAEMGCPIVGDRRYGARTDPIHRLGLHACFLAFTHPVTGERIRLRLPLPGTFRAA
jgi:23S rRNA pseudouridine1911/1915/1917 synthase